MPFLKSKWRVIKCNKPSTRWVAWRAKQKRRTGKVFDSWTSAIRYAICMSQCDK